MIQAMKEIKAEQLAKLPRQNARCPAAIAQIDSLDKKLECLLMNMLERHGATVTDTIR